MSPQRRHCGTARLAFAVLLLAAPSAPAQLTWNLTFLDSGGVGFADPTLGTTRQNTVTAATNYISSQIDARGTINIQFNPSTTATGAGTLALARLFFVAQTGLSNGQVFQRATTNSASFAPPDGDALYNFAADVPWNNGIGAPASGEYDLFSITLHELTHTLDFNTLIRSTGAGGFNNPVGSPDAYTRFDSFIKRGSTNTFLVTSSASFNTPAATAADLSSDDLFFDGPITRAANGGNPVKVYAPNPFQGGSSVSHVDNLPNGVMLPVASPGAVRRSYLNQELAMLIDVGWNTFSWKGTNGSWAENAATTTTPRWVNADGQDMLSPVGSITPNLVLRFGGSGSTAYTSTNDLPANPFQVMRMVLASSSTSTNTIAGNKLQFGSSIGVQPQIQQIGSGAFNIATPIDLTAAGLELTGNGTGVVTLAGPIAANGAVTKTGTGTFVLTGSNTYAGGTAVNGGALLVSNSTGSGTGGGSVTVGAGGTLGGHHAGTGSMSGPVTVNGAIAPGPTTGTVAGLLRLGSGLTVASGGNYFWSMTALADNSTGLAGTDFDQVVLTASNLSINPGASLTLDFTGGIAPAPANPFWQAIHSWTVVNLTGTATNTGSTNFGTIVNATTFASAGTFSLDANSGLVVLTFTPVPEPLFVMFVMSVAGAAWWKTRERLRT